MIPAGFGDTHPSHGTPHRAVLLTGLLTLLAPLMGRQALLSFVNAGSLCIGIAFLGVALSVMTLRRSHPNLARPFKLPGGRVIPSLAAAGSVFLLAVPVMGLLLVLGPRVLPEYRDPDAGRLDPLSAVMAIGS